MISLIRRAKDALLPSTPKPDPFLESSSHKEISDLAKEEMLKAKLGSEIMFEQFKAAARLEAHKVQASIKAGEYMVEHGDSALQENDTVDPSMRAQLNTLIRERTTHGLDRMRFIHRESP